MLGLTPCAGTQSQAEESSDHPLMVGHRTKTIPLDTYSGMIRSEGKDLLREYWIMHIYMILDLVFKAEAEEAAAEEAAAEHGVLGLKEQSDREELQSGGDWT